MLIHSIVTSFIALCLTTAAFAQQTADSTQEPAAISNAFFKAMLDEDATSMGKLLGSDCSLISFDGSQVDGDLLLQGISGGFVVIESGTVSGTQTRQYNNDSSVITGKWKVKGTIQGQPLNADASFTVICARQSGTWKIVNVQFTPSR